MGEQVWFFLMWGSYVCVAAGGPILCGLMLDRGLSRNKKRETDQLRELEKGR